MSLLSLWTSTITNPLEKDVSHIMSSYGDFPFAYDSVNIAGESPQKITEILNEEFGKLVKVSMSDTTLHIIAIVPCFEKEAESRFRSLGEACLKLEHNISLHVIGLGEGLTKLFETKAKVQEAKQHVEGCRRILKEYSNLPSFSFSYTLIDDYASNGASIGFTIESLARYIALIEQALGQNYYSILSPALLGSHRHDNLSIGVSSLSFPKKSAVKQLLGKGFLAALDNVGINDTEVDSQKAAHEAEMFLANIEHRYPNLYKNAIRPLFKENGMTESKAVGEASDIIKENLEEIRQDVINLLKDPDFSFPEKESILAMILGRDNANLHGIQYEHEGIILDDACNDPINLYVDAYNKYCIDSGLLPVRGDFEVLEIKEWDEAEKKWKDLPENHRALNPLPQIKKLKQQILNTTSFLREKQEELKKLQESANLRDDAEEVRRQWHKPEGNLRDFEYKEQPLDQKYEPKPGLKSKRTVDLRKYFPPVRSQLDLGSCTSFAVEGMYEAMMKINGYTGKEYMSPGYLFYYSNILKGRPTGGSNYHDQLEVMGTHGICYDDLYNYDSRSPEKIPTEAAEEDAKTHRVLAAKQIPQPYFTDKLQNIKETHKYLTAALSEGYPVGISLKVFDNLGKDGAFVLHPQDASGAKEEGYHAMIITGYSEDNGFYIVRNSWGEGFGDEGYCYIPFAYIDDPDYLDFACIITEITDGNDTADREIPTVLANFGATESEIKMAAIRNAIATVRTELQTYQALYAEYYKYYQRLMLRLTMPNVQNTIRKEAEKGQARNFVDVETSKRELEETFVGKLKEFRKSLLTFNLLFLGATLVTGIMWYYTSSVVMMILFIVFASFSVLLWLGYKWWLRLRRRELQEQLDGVAVNARNQREILLEMQIKFHVAGMWLSNFHKLSNELGNLYERLVSFNDTLRQWQKDYADNVGNPEEAEGIMFRMFDPSSRLDKFFNDHKKEIVAKIDLLKVFKEYNANVEGLDKSREDLHATVSDSIMTLMENFNIVNYLLGEEVAYLPVANLQEEIDAMIQVGQPSYRNPDRHATSPVRMLIGNVEPQQEGKWGNAIAPFFPLRPVVLRQKDPDTLILLTLHPLTS